MEIFSIVSTQTKTTSVHCLPLIMYNANTTSDKPDETLGVFMMLLRS